MDVDGLEAALERLRAKRSSVSESISDEDACTLCGGLGYIARRDANTGEVFSRDCKCEIIRQNKRRIARSGLSSLLERCTMESYQTPDPWQKAAKAMAQQFVQDHYGKWFFIGGSSGSGKTHLCTAICGELMNAGCPVRYVQWRTDIPSIKAVINDPEAYHMAIGPLKNIRVLYIDDFLKGGITDGDKNVAFDLLNTRYNQPDLVTIISTEMTIDKVLAWDEAIGGRIAERSHGYTLNLCGKQNWRLM